MAIIDRRFSVFPGFAAASTTDIIGGIVDEAVSMSKLRRAPERVIIDSTQVDQQVSGHRVTTLRDAVDDRFNLQVGDVGRAKMAKRRDDVPLQRALNLSPLSRVSAADLRRILR